MLHFSQYREVSQVLWSDQVVVYLELVVLIPHKKEKKDELIWD
jgi:hypothetical protein